jgi:uncharacterized membrane protein
MASRLFLVLSSVFLLFFLLLLPLKLLVFHEGFYDQQFEDYGVYETLGHDVVVEQMHHVFSFLRWHEPLGDFFSERARLHMDDVWLLYQIACWVFYLSLVGLFFCLFFGKGKIGKIVLTGSSLSLVVFIVVIVFASLYFSSFFTFFHEMFFSNDLWLFDPTDHLVMLFPEGFFVSFVETWLTTSLLLSLVGVGVGKTLDK